MRATFKARTPPGGGGRKGSTVRPAVGKNKVVATGKLAAAAAAPKAAAGRPRPTAGEVPRRTSRAGTAAGSDLRQEAGPVKEVMARPMSEMVVQLEEMREMLTQLEAVRDGMRADMASGLSVDQGALADVEASARARGLPVRP